MEFTFMTPQATVPTWSEQPSRKGRSDTSRRASPLTPTEQHLVQDVADQLGFKKSLRQQIMRDQDRERAMVKGAVYRSGLEAAMLQQVSLAEAEQKQQAAAELERLADAYDRRVGRLGEAHVEAALYMQEQELARAAQESRRAELNDLQAQRYQSALSAVKAQNSSAKSLAQQQQERRAQILKAERDKAQAFSAEQAQREQERKRRQSEQARQEMQRRKRSANGLAVDFRHTRLHEGQGAPGPVAVPAVIAPPIPAVPDPVESAEEVRHRAAMEKRRREAAAAEAEFRARERFLAAQAKLRADAQKQAVEAELAQLAAQRLQAKKQALAAHRTRLQDQRKQQDLQRVFEENFLAGQEDDLAPRALPAFLQPSATVPVAVPAAAARGGRVPAPTVGPTPHGGVGVQGLPPPVPVAAAPDAVAVPRWSKGRTAPLGRQPPALPVPHSQVTAPPSRGEIAVQTDPEPPQQAEDRPTSPQQRQPSSDLGASPYQESKPAEQPCQPQQSPRQHSGTPGSSSVAGVLPGASGDPSRRLAWPDNEAESRPAGAPRAPPAPKPAHGGTGGQVQAPARRRGTLEDLQSEDGGDAEDAWAEEEVDRELARMKRELGIEDSDLRSSVSSLNSSVSVPAFLGESAERTAARQASREAAVRSAAGQPRAGAGQAPHLPAAASGPGPAQAVPVGTPGRGSGRAPSGQVHASSSPPRMPVPAAAHPAAERPAAVSPRGQRPPSSPRREETAPMDAPPSASSTPATASRQASPPTRRVGAQAAGGRAGGGGTVPSPAGTLDSSILRLLNTPSSMTASQTTTPGAAGVAAAASTQRPVRSAGGRAVPGSRLQAPGFTPGASSLPSDLDDVLLLTELDWEELEGLAGLRGGNGVAKGAAGTTPGRTGAFSSGLGSSPVASSLSSVSAVSDESVRRLVAQGLLPPEIAMLLAGTPTSAAATASFTATALTDSALPMGRSPARTAAAPVAGSPTVSSALSGLTALLAPQAAPAAGAQDPAASSLSSLSAYAAALARSMGQPGGTGAPPAPAYPHAAAAAGRPVGLFAAPGLHHPAGSLFTNPERATVGLRTPPDPFSPSSTSPAAAVTPSTSSSSPSDMPHVARLLRPQALGLQPLGAMGRLAPGTGLPEPVKLTLADLNRSLLAAAGAGVGPGPAAPAHPAKPARPGPMLITALDPPPMTRPMQPPPPLQPPRVQLLGSQQQQPGQGIFGWVPPDGTSTPSSSSLSLSPPRTTVQPPAQGPLVSAGGGGAGPGRPRSPKAAAPRPPPPVVSPGDTSSSLSSLGVGTSGLGVPVGRGGGAPRDTHGAVASPAADAGGRFAAGRGSESGGVAPARPENPYDLYDKEQARLAELMASITASLKQSAEAVSRAGTQSRGSGSSPLSSPNTSIAQASSRGGAAAAGTGGLNLASLSLSSSSLSSLALQATQSLPLHGTQSPVAALLASARAAGRGSAESSPLTPTGAAAAAGVGHGSARGPRPSTLGARGGGGAPPQRPEPSGRTRAGAASLAAPLSPSSLSTSTLSSLPVGGSATLDAVTPAPGGGITPGASSTVISTPGQSSSVLSLSSVMALIREHAGPQAPSAPLPPPSPAAPVPALARGPTGAIPLSRLGQPPASPPPSMTPLTTAASPAISVPSPPTPWSPMLSDSASSPGSDDPGATPLSALSPEPAPGRQAPLPPDPAAASEVSSLLSLPVPAAPGSRLCDVLSSSDALSSVAEAIASVIARRQAATAGATGAEQGVPGAQERSAQQQSVPSTTDPSGPPHDSEPSSSVGQAGGHPGPPADDNISSSPSSSTITGGPRADVWASLTGQSLAEALAGLLTPEGRYDDLLRSSLALSVSSLDASVFEESLRAIDLTASGALGAEDSLTTVDREVSGAADADAALQDTAGRGDTWGGAGVGAGSVPERRGPSVADGAEQLVQQQPGPLDVGLAEESAWAAERVPAADMGLSADSSSSSGRTRGQDGFGSGAGPAARPQSTATVDEAAYGEASGWQDGESASPRAAAGVEQERVSREQQAGPESWPADGSLGGLGADAVKAPYPFPTSPQSSASDGEEAPFSAAPTAEATPLSALPAAPQEGQAGQQDPGGPDGGPAFPLADLSELRSSADSDEFSSIMAGLLQDIQRGLASLQIPQAPPAMPQPLQRDPQRSEELPPWPQSHDGRQGGRPAASASALPEEEADRSPGPLARLGGYPSDGLSMVEEEGSEEGMPGTVAAQQPRRSGIGSGGKSGSSRDGSSSHGDGAQEQGMDEASGHEGWAASRGQVGVASALGRGLEAGRPVAEHPDLVSPGVEGALTHPEFSSLGSASEPLDGRAAASAAGPLQHMPPKPASTSDGSDGQGGEGDDDVVWWPDRPTSTAGQQPGPLPGVSVRSPGPDEGLEPGPSGSATEVWGDRRELLSLPTFSRGFAEAAPHSPTSPRSPRDANPGLWFGGDAASQRLSAASRHSSFASLASAPEPSEVPPTAAALSAVSSAARASGSGDGARSGGASSDGAGGGRLTPARLGSPQTPGGGAALGETGTYSFSQLPRASLTRVRVPPSVNSGNDSPSRAPSGGSSTSPSVSTVSSLDSLTAALAEYPVFGGAADSPMGSPSHSEASSGAGAGGGLGATGGDGGAGPLGDSGQEVAAGLGGEPAADSQDADRLPIQFESLQPAPTQLSQSPVEQEPWRGAWDPPVSLAWLAGGGARAGGPASTAAAGGTRGDLQPSSSAPRGRPAQQGAPGPEPQVTMFGDAGGTPPQSPPGDDTGLSGAGDGWAPQQLDPWEEQALVPADPWFDEQQQRGQRGQEGEEEAGQGQGQRTQRVSSPTQGQGLAVRRPGLSVTPLALTTSADDDSVAHGVVNLTARALAADQGPAARASPSTSPAPPAAASSLAAGSIAGVFSSPHEGRHQGAVARASPPRALSLRGLGLALEDEFVAVTPRGFGDAGRRRSSGGGVAGSYAAALSEEQLTHLLHWTVSDFFSSPGSGGSGDAD